MARKSLHPRRFIIHRSRLGVWLALPEQLQARPLPVKLSATYFKGLFRKIEVTENRDGFIVAEPLPFIDGFPVEVPPGKTHLFARYRARGCGSLAMASHCRGLYSRSLDYRLRVRYCLEMGARCRQVLCKASPLAVVGRF